MNKVVYIILVYMY